MVQAVYESRAEEDCVDEGHRTEVYEACKSGRGCSFWVLRSQQGLHASPTHELFKECEVDPSRSTNVMLKLIWLDARQVLSK